jgi:hypothetical protein
MKKIFIRSPYFIEVAEEGQTSAKIEVFLWNKGSDEPATPTYTLSENIPSPTQIAINWNVSNFAKEFIKPIATFPFATPRAEKPVAWCHMKVVRYSDDVELDEETFICLNGYTSYAAGMNAIRENEVLPLFNPNLKILNNNNTLKYVNVFLEANTYYYGSVTGAFFTIEEDDMVLLPYSTGGTYTLQQGETPYFSFQVENVCEPIYTPVNCTFINRTGGWQYLTFFKANSSGIDVTSKDFNLLPASVNYNVLQGQKQRFNFQGKQKIKCNTGWVDENYFELIQDLLLSEVVLLDNKPVIVKSQSADVKTHLKDKNINYEIEFEYNYGLINDVI